MAADDPTTFPALEPQTSRRQKRHIFRRIALAVLVVVLLAAAYDGIALAHNQQSSANTWPAINPLTAFSSGQATTHQPVATATPAATATPTSPPIPDYASQWEAQKSLPFSQTLRVHIVNVVNHQETGAQDLQLTPGQIVFLDNQSNYTTSASRADLALLAAYMENVYLIPSGRGLILQVGVLVNGKKDRLYLALTIGNALWAMCDFGNGYWGSGCGETVDVGGSFLSQQGDADGWDGLARYLRGHILGTTISLGILLPHATTDFLHFPPPAITKKLPINGQLVNFLRYPSGPAPAGLLPGNGPEPAVSQLSPVDGLADIFAGAFYAS
jgi:hypothetical protein